MTCPLGGMWRTGKRQARRGGIATGRETSIQGAPAGLHLASIASMACVSRDLLAMCARGG